MRALVTGACGFAGKHLTRLLEAEGMQVVGYDTCDRGGVQGDVRDYEQLLAAVEQTEPDYVFHLAALASPPHALSDPRRGVDVNVTGTLNLLEAVRHSGVRPRVHLAGTSEEIGYQHDSDTIDERTCTRPTQPYGVTKLAASLLGLAYARHHGLHVVVTRAFNHAGPGANARYAVGAFCKRLIQVERGFREDVPVGNLEGRRNLLDVRDVVRAYRLVVDQPPGSVYVVCGRDTPTMGEVLAELIRLTGREVTVRLDEALWRSEPADLPRPSSKLLEQETGWRQEIPLEQTLADTLAWYRRREEL
jgi:GDP-4-dehydro-6-deoxy-D-mannose reductase